MTSCALSPTGRECRESTDPRHEGRCFRCDAPVHSANGSYPRRNTLLESQIVEYATRGVLHFPGVLGHAQTRSKRLSAQYVSDPGLIRPDLNRDLEGREEAADGVNHCLFRLQLSPDAPGDDHRLTAIRYFALAWEELRKAEDAE